MVCGYRSVSLLIINDPELRVKTSLSSAVSVLMAGLGWIITEADQNANSDRISAKQKMVLALRESAWKYAVNSSVTFFL